MRKFFFIATIITIFLIFPILSACQKTETFSINYVCSEGGYIEGQANQTVKKGENSLSVTAIPNEGYIFTHWSDGSTNATRSDNNISENLTITAYFYKLSYMVAYSAAKGGTIKGEIYQYLPYGSKTTEVTAIPNENYRFIGWDDGFSEITRSDIVNVTEPKTYTALFKQIGTIFNLVYNNATENADISNVLVYFDSAKNATFPIPQRINSTFEGWYLDKDFTTQITDKNGKLIDDNIISNYDTTNLYAKFSLIKDVKYKILMVYVTAIKGIFETDHGETIVDYKMSESEMKICEKITQNFELALNEMFSGLVRFDIDSYFTKQIINEESFSKKYDDYHLYANDIPELMDFELLDNYRSVFTSISFVNKYDSSNTKKFHSNQSIRKYACVYLEDLIGDIITNNKVDLLLDPNNVQYETQWKYILAHYAHEFCYTVEHQISDRILHKYDEAREIYLPDPHPVADQLEVIKLYLLNQAQDKEGVKFGIPYDFWSDSIKFDITFIAGENGTISGNLNQTVAIGGKTETVTAIPNFGYKFVKWSTGQTDPILTYREVYNNETVVAIFKEISRYVVYYNIIVIDDKEWIKTEMVELHYKDFLSTTLYIPENIPDGYEFEGLFLDPEFTLPVGDKYGKVTEDDYDKIFDKDLNDSVLFLYGKFSKK